MLMMLLITGYFVELIPHETHQRRRPSPKLWQPVRPEEAAKLSDSRLQLQHAAQFGAAAGISFLPRLSDDSHSNLEWVPALGGLFSRVIPTRTPFRVGVKPVKLAVVMVTNENQPIAEYRLHGRTIIETRDWIRSQIKLLGANGSRYTLTRSSPPSPDHHLSPASSDAGRATSTSQRSSRSRRDAPSESDWSLATITTTSRISTSACVHSLPPYALDPVLSGAGAPGTPLSGSVPFFLARD